VPQRGGGQAGGGLGRMLEIRVHDQDPVAARVPGGRDHGPGQSALPSCGRAFEQPDRQRALGRGRDERGGRLVVAVVGDHELCVEAGHRPVEPGEQGADVVRLVPGGDKDRELRMRGVLRAVRIDRARHADVVGRLGFRHRRGQRGSH